ncbi:hypothetical protein FQA47_021838 [Oryzias melastigma]|uniref:Uncharacterized protein n=1 Tax=Oryzias melastigma TaxID=30732 RepID=A0A834F3J9_ORYME|nr:hypothetical protein FQA47_021838 [Oryzias melastigma]
MGVGAQISPPPSPVPLFGLDCVRSGEGRARRRCARCGGHDGMAAEARAPGSSYISWPRFITLKGPAALSERGGEGGSGSRRRITSASSRSVNGKEEQRRARARRHDALFSNKEGHPGKLSEVELCGRRRRRSLWRRDAASS